MDAKQLRDSRSYFHSTTLVHLAADVPSYSASLFSPARSFSLANHVDIPRVPSVSSTRNLGRLCALPSYPDLSHSFSLSLSLSNVRHSNLGRSQETYVPNSRPRDYATREKPNMKPYIELYSSRGRVIVNDPPSRGETSGAYFPWKNLRSR